MKLDDSAYRHLMKIVVSKWLKHAFDKATKSPHITNNACKSFNEWINKFRDKPITTLVDGLRTKIMTSFYRKFQGISWQHKVRL